MRTVRANEKVKRLSTLIGNGGLALLITGFSHLSHSGLNLTSLAWIFLACGIMLVSLQFNELLGPEDEA